MKSHSRGHLTRRQQQKRPTCSERQLSGLSGRSRRVFTFSRHAVMQVEEGSGKKLPSEKLLLTFPQSFRLLNVFPPSGIHASQTSGRSYIQQTLPLPAPGRATLPPRRPEPGDPAGSEETCAYFKIKAPQMVGKPACTQGTSRTLPSCYE